MYRSNTVIIRNIASYDTPFMSNIWWYWYRMKMVNNCVFLWLKKQYLVYYMCVFNNNYLYNAHILVYMECLFM